MRFVLLRIALFVLRLTVPVNNFSVLSGRSQRLPGYYQYFQGVKCLAQGHNTAEVGFETPTSRSGVCGYTTEPPFSPELPCRDYSNEHLHHMSSLIGNLFFAYAKTKTQITCNSFGYMIVLYNPSSCSPEREVQGSNPRTAM